MSTEPWLKLAASPETSGTLRMSDGPSTSTEVADDRARIVHGRHGSSDDDEDAPMPTAFANLRPHSPPPMERGDSQREADHAWARAQAAAPETPALAPPDRALSRSAPPSLASSSHGGGDSRTGSPRTGGDDEECFSDAESQGEAPDLPDVLIGSTDTPALSFTIEGTSPAPPASSAATPADEDEEELDAKG